MLKRGRRLGGVAPYLASVTIATFVLSGAAMIASSISPAVAQDAAFESALAAQPPRGATVVQPANAAATVSPTKKTKAAPAPLPHWRGTGVPSELRAMRTMPYGSSPEGATITRAFREGRLDIAALYEQVEGPLPLPPGARLLDCPASADGIYFSLGLPLAPAYLAGVQALEEEARRPVDPEDAADPYPMRKDFDRQKEVWAQQGSVARRALTTIGSHFTAAGFTLPSKLKPEWVRPSRGGGPMKLRMYVEMQSHDADEACRKLGYTAPNSPMVRVWYL